MKKDISICIVSYNVKDDLRECLSSIRNNLKGIGAEVIVVDNASRDGSAAMAKELFPEFLIIESRENLGFAKANNVAFRNSHADAILFLNPDTVITGRGFKGALDDFMSRKELGAMGPKLLNADGSLQQGLRRFPGVFDTIVRFTFLRKLPFLDKLTQGYRMRGFDFDSMSEIDQISGAAFFIKRDVFMRVGLFDENFFVFYEEVDLCRRIWESGLKIVYDPSMEIIHKGGQSRKENNNLVRSINIKSVLYYFRKHEKGWKKAFFLATFKTLFAADILVELLFDAFLYYCPFCRQKKKQKRLEKMRFRVYFLKNNLIDFLFRW
jgi:GT2 family glycosyltransferase